jgi:methionine-gamma-lyase
VFLTSTFVFRTAEDGKAFFDYTSGRREAPPGEGAGLVYSRFNNPNLEVLEDRLALWEGGESAAVFSSGMAAITTSILAHVRPNDVILMSLPLYGGTETLIEKTLPALGVRAVGFTDGCSKSAVFDAMEQALALARGAGGRVSFIMTETPANPTNSIVDLALVRRAADEIARRQGGEAPPVAVDNTYLGPIYQRPLALGADLVVYSLTKYVGGHSDLVAGGVVGAKARVKRVRLLRSSLGTQLDANTAWMIMRSMETLSLRMRAAADNAQRVATFLAGHPRVSEVNYLGLLPGSDPRTAVFRRQCGSAGSTFAFKVGSGEADAFRMLNRLQVIKLAVSLGGTETLISHPASTTHSGVPQATRERYGITDAMVRISVGVEHPDDLIADLDLALR